MGYHNPRIQNEIRKRATEGRVIYSQHAEERQTDRDIDDAEILHCLKHGLLISEDWDAKYQDTTYRMERKKNLAASLIVIVALDEHDGIVVSAFVKE